MDEIAVLREIAALRIAILGMAEECRCYDIRACERCLGTRVLVRLPGLRNTCYHYYSGDGLCAWTVPLDECDLCCGREWVPEPESWKWWEAIFNAFNDVQLTMFIEEWKVDWFRTGLPELAFYRLLRAELESCVLALVEEEIKDVT